MEYPKIKLNYGHNFNDSSVSEYLRAISKYPRLTKEQELELGKRVRLYQDQDSIDTLVTSNLGFVVSFAKKYLGRGLEMNDLIGEGNLGLIKAAKRFDERKNAKFITYAAWWVQQSIDRALWNVKVLGPKESFRSLYTSMHWYSIDHLARYGREPTIEELTDRFLSDRVDSESKKMLLTGFYQYKQRILSLDEEINDADKSSRTRHDLIVEGELSFTDSTIESKIEEEEVDLELRRILNPRELRIIRGYFYETESLQSMANELGLSRERARQIKEEGIKKLSRSSVLTSLTV